MKVLGLAGLVLGFALNGLSFANSLSLCKLEANDCEKHVGGYDFSAADALFAKRGEGANDNERFQNATAAFNAYTAAFNTTTGEDKLYAFTQRGRLNIFRTLMLDVDSSLKTDVLNTCIKEAESVAKDYSQRQESYYFLLACMGTLGRMSNIAKRAMIAYKMSKIQWPALDSTKIDGQYVGGFEGGGVLRIMAALRGNAEARPVGLYNAEDAVSFAATALATDSKVVRPFPNPLGGNDYYENFYYHVGALLSLAVDKDDLSKVNEAKDELITTLQIISDLRHDDALPKGREPELGFYEKKMQVMKAYVETCQTQPQSTWIDCLNKRVD